MPLTEAINERHRREVDAAYAAVNRLRVAAWASAAIGAVAFVWTAVAMIAGEIEASEGVVFLAGTALGTVVPAAGLHAAGFRTSLSAARLERDLMA